MSPDRIYHIAAASGGILYIMAFLLLVAFTVIIERSWYLKRVIRKGNKISLEIEKLSHLDNAHIRDMAKEYARYPQGALLTVPLSHPEIQDSDRLSGLLDEAIMRQAPEVDRSLWMLDTIVTLGPLLGLLGTIIGMFNAFQVLGSVATAPTQITGGVAEALVATACGLLVAIIGLICFNALNNDVRLIIHQMDIIKVSLVNRLVSPRPSMSAQFDVARSDSGAPAATGLDVSV